MTNPTPGSWIKQPSEPKSEPPAKEAPEGSAPRVKKPYVPKDHLEHRPFKTELMESLGNLLKEPKRRPRRQGEKK